MSHELTQRNQPRALLQVGDPKATTNPVGSLLPFEARGPVNRLWVCYSHLLPSSLSLASTIRVYLDDHGLHPDDLPSICSRLLSPEYQSQHKFASDLFASLAALVAEIIRRRRAAEETARRLAESAMQRRGWAPPAEFLERLRGIGRPVDDIGFTPEG